MKKKVDQAVTVVLSDKTTHSKLKEIPCSLRADAIKTITQLNQLSSVQAGANYVRVFKNNKEIDINQLYKL